ncbi:GH39 family glycosyl hydrolase [Acetobacter fallax]|uniref:Cellulase family glycosylhydrolase n=1 Tax=Acetobacter fallax TaxID=1737473 RepID=A0ABX0KDH1_9PROT|nr:cellulase family glycosylhydrolase [Acetobacter fallax]NHO33131.1 cellulase family glycosylhydrolase [Acetobacter fallax]NHO36721.1 cellulase family glycosylhydrolase [Acetobacter fallax]
MTGKYLSCLLLLSSAVALVPSARAQTDEIVIDSLQEGKPFPHFWETMFGSGRAVLGLRENYLKNMSLVKSAANFNYVRFHGIFGDEMGIVSLGDDGRPVYNFRYVDQVYDALLARGVRPFVELGYMPGLLGADAFRRRGGLQPMQPQAPKLHRVTDYSSGTFWYRANVSPPENYAQWDDLIRTFTRHVEDRYGKDEVRHWYFEVWNEPNQASWTGNPQMETYFTLYDHTARAIKDVDPQLKVGGPATATTSWVPEFLAHIATAHSPIDFLSTHVYANDPPERVPVADALKTPAHMVCAATAHVKDMEKDAKQARLPLIISEFGADWNSANGLSASTYIGPWLAQTAHDCDGLTEMMSYWTFSDNFEEQGIPGAELPGIFGIVSEQGIPKPALNAFRLLHRLGNRRLPESNDAALVTRDADGHIDVAFWNYHTPDLSEAQLASDGMKKIFHVRVRSSSVRTPVKARLWRVDQAHGNVMPAYRRLGMPVVPTPAQQKVLVQAAAPDTGQEVVIPAEGIDIAVPAQGLALLEVARGSVD